MFNVMSNSIRYRENIYNIQAFEADGYTAGIYQEIVAFAWETFLFEPLYPADYEALQLDSPYFRQQVVDSPWMDLTEEYELPAEHDYHSYAFVSGLIDRYTDFFEPNTKMRYFQSNFTVFEQLLART